MIYKMTLLPLPRDSGRDNDTLEVCWYLSSGDSILEIRNWEKTYPNSKSVFDINLN